MVLRQEKEEALVAVMEQLRTDVQKGQQALDRKRYEKEMLLPSEWNCWNLLNLFQQGPVQIQG